MPQTPDSAFDREPHDGVRDDPAFEAPTKAPINPAELLALARGELLLGRLREAQTTLMRLLTGAPSCVADVVALARELRQQQAAEPAYAAVEVAVDTALLDGKLDEAIALLQAFLEGDPFDRALAKLIDICAEAGRDDVRRQAQGQLADLYIAGGRIGEARPLAEALVASEPESEAHVVRLRTVLAMLGVEDVDLAVGLARAASPSATLRVVDAGAEPHPEFAGPAVEIDLSARVEDLAGEDGAEAASESAQRADPARALERFFSGVRADVGGSEGTAQAAERFHSGLGHLEQGRIAEGVADLQIAARSAAFRFQAASRLAELHRSQGDLYGMVEWLEQAVEVPGPTAAETHAALYELGDALERIQEPARAIAVLVELDAAQPAYRDVRDRLDRLSALRAGDER